jgi:hypothetical protein
LRAGKVAQGLNSIKRKGGRKERKRKKEKEKEKEERERKKEKKGRKEGRKEGRGKERKEIRVKGIGQLAVVINGGTCTLTSSPSACLSSSFSPSLSYSNS